MLTHQDCLMVHQNLFKTDARLAAKCVSYFGLGYRQVTTTIHCLIVTSASHIFDFCLSYFQTKAAAIVCICTPCCGGWLHFLSCFLETTQPEYALQLKQPLMQMQNELTVVSGTLESRLCDKYIQHFRHLALQIPLGELQHL